MSFAHKRWVNVLSNEILWWAMSPKKIDRFHNWVACLQDRAQPNACVSGHLVMLEPSYWALFIDNMAILRLLNLHLLQCFLVQPSSKSFSLPQMINRLNSGERKGGIRERVLGRWKETLLCISPSPPHLCARHQALSPPHLLSGVSSDIYFEPIHMLCFDYCGNF